tara:strand:- start:1458 stop:3077 length:1620 start_codon:yes stop_codon:yes gene_type:complete
MSEYENFETFLEQVNEVMKGRMVRGVQYGGAGPAKEWDKNNQYDDGDKVFIIENEVKKYYRYEPIDELYLQYDLQLVPDVSDFWVEIDKEEGEKEDDDSSSDVESTSEVDNTPTMVVSDDVVLDDHMGQDDDEQEKLKKDISDAFDKIINLEKQKEELNNKITNSEDGVDEIIKKMNDLKKDIKLPPSLPDLSIEEEVEEEVKWQANVTQNDDDDDGTEEEVNLLDLISINLEEMEDTGIDTEIMDINLGDEVLEPGPALTRTSSSLSQTVLTGEGLEELINSLGLKEDEIKILKKQVEELQEKEGDPFDQLKKLKIMVFQDPNLEYFKVWETVKKDLQAREKNSSEENVIEHIKIHSPEIYSKVIETIKKQLKTDQDAIEKNIESNKRRFNDLKKREREKTDDDGDNKKQDTTLRTDIVDQLAALAKHTQDREQLRAQYNILENQEKDRKGAVAERIFKDGAVATDKKPPERKKVVPQRNLKPRGDLMTEGSTSTGTESSTGIGPSTSVQGGGRKKRKNRTLKKKRNKFLVYLENLYG